MNKSFNSKDILKLVLNEIDNIVEQDNLRLEYFNSLPLEPIKPPDYDQIIECTQKVKTVFDNIEGKSNNLIGDNVNKLETIKKKLKEKELEIDKLEDDLVLIAKEKGNIEQSMATIDEQIKTTRRNSPQHVREEIQAYKILTKIHFCLKNPNILDGYVQNNNFERYYAFNSDKTKKSLPEIRKNFWKKISKMTDVNPKLIADEILELK